MITWDATDTLQPHYSPIRRVIRSTHLVGVRQLAV
jgi:hypothetical protein